MHTTCLSAFYFTADDLLFSTGDQFIGPWGFSGSLTLREKMTVVVFLIHKTYIIQTLTSTVVMVITVAIITFFPGVFVNYSVTTPARLYSTLRHTYMHTDILTYVWKLTAIKRAGDPTELLKIMQSTVLVTEADSINNSNLQC